VFRADLVAVWEAIGTIPASETIADAAARLCRFDADDASIPSALRAIDESVLPLEVPWAPWMPQQQQQQSGSAPAGTGALGGGAAAATAIEV
jgi:hypothetical protein